MKAVHNVIFITGISSGFGLECARQLHAEGHIVYGTVRKAVEQELDGVHYITGVDVRDEESIRNAVQRIVEEQGRIDVFINNAGMGTGGPIEFTPTEDVQTQIDTNFIGLVRCVRHVLPVMRGQKGGIIMAMSSIGGLVGLPFQGFYSASKFAVEGYCEALRIEVRKFGIKVVVVEPGDFSTGFTAKRIKAIGPEVAEAYPCYAKTMSGIEKDEKNGLTPAVLAKRICRIITKRHPGHSYIIATPLQSMAVFLKAILPSRLFSRLLALFYGIK